MHTKKIILSGALGLIMAILATSSFVHAANLNQAAATLPANDEWSVMAYASLGQSVGQDFLRSPVSGPATDIEKRILAITAIGENPRTFGSEDLIAKLESNFFNEQLGDPALLNDDIFGVLALSSAGISDSDVSASRQFILAHENSDGGWGYAIGTGSDSNTTAMAIAALAITGGAPNSAFDYLATTQDSNGGYGFTPGTATDGASTAWVIAGLNSAGRSVPGTATAFLESLQLPDGSFKWKPADSSGSGLVTAYAIIALSGHGIPVRTVSVSTNPSPTPTPVPTPAPSPTLTPTPTPVPTPMPMPNLTPTPIATPTPTPPATTTLGYPCYVPIFNTNFAFPPEGGKIVTIDGQMYFVQTYQPGCANAGSTGTPLAPTLAPAISPTAIPSAIPTTNTTLGYPCYVPIFNTNFAFPPEGGKIVTIDGQMYFVQTYQPGCANAGSTGTPVAVSGTPQTTQTAQIQSNNSIPLVAPVNNQSLVRVTITYNSFRIFAGSVNFSSGMTALDALSAASAQGGFPVDLRQTSLGSYVAGIDGYPAAGSTGWQYAVNGSVPASAANTVALNRGDSIQWFYGAPGSAPY